MGAGVDAVKAEIARAFGSVPLVEYHDPHTLSTVLGFASEQRNLLVRVSIEFDQDFESGQLAVDLSQLAPTLLSSKSGKALVRTDGILSA